MECISMGSYVYYPYYPVFLMLIHIQIDFFFHVHPLAAITLMPSQSLLIDLSQSWCRSNCVTAINIISSSRWLVGLLGRQQPDPYYIEATLLLLRPALLCVLVSRSSLLALVERVRGRYSYWQLALFCARARGSVTVTNHCASFRFRWLSDYYYCILSLFFIFFFALGGGWRMQVDDAH